MDPLFEDMPEQLFSERLVLRCARADDAPAMNAAVTESLDDLRSTMLWAQVAPTPAQSEADCRRFHAKFLLREDATMFMFERRADGSEGAFIGGAGMHRIDWAVRKFEIGYWCRVSQQGRGYVTEAVLALKRHAFERLRAGRVELRMNDDNVRSRRVAERAGFTLEGVLRHSALNPQGELRDTRVYALTRAGDPGEGSAAGIGIGSGDARPPDAAATSARVGG